MCGNIRSTLNLINNDIKGNKGNSKTLFKIGECIRTDIIEKFKEYDNNWKSYIKEDDYTLYYDRINKFVNSNPIMIKKIYNSYLNKYNMELKFIKNGYKEFS